MTIRIKALIPAAGRGTRLSTVTGGSHKELLRIGRLTMIEHCLKMVSDSGVTDVGLVIRDGKEDVLDQAERFWRQLQPSGVPLTVFRQPEPRGVADAMFLAADFAGNAPLAVLMPDNLVIGGAPPLATMIRAFGKVQGNIIGAISLPPERAHLFGHVGLLTLKAAEEGLPPLVATLSPKQKGRLSAGNREQYKGMTGVIYLPGWADRISGLTPNHQGEIDDTDLVTGFVKEKSLYAALLDGEGFDIGNPDGLEAARRCLAQGKDE